MSINRRPREVKPLGILTRADQFFKLAKEKSQGGTSEAQSHHQIPDKLMGLRFAGPTGAGAQLRVAMGTNLRHAAGQRLAQLNWPQ